MFINTHPKSMLQKVGLPNFVDKDILNTKYIISILEAFKLLGLNIIYILIPKDNNNHNKYNNDDFIYINIDTMIMRLKAINTPLCQLIIKSGPHKEKQWVIQAIIETKSIKDQYYFDSYKMAPYFNKLYNI